MVEDILKDGGGLLNSEGVQDQLLRQLLRNTEQLNFKARARLLSHLQDRQKVEVEVPKPSAPTSGTFPFTVPDAE
jgi:hypothetical protein